MAQCSAIKGDGTRCKGTATAPHGYCWGHSPEHAEQCRRMASKAAKSKPSREVRQLKSEVKDLAQLYRVLKDFLELERRQQEVDEINYEIKELKDRLGVS